MDRIYEIKNLFYKKTDNLSLYPIQSELIYDNFSKIIDILNNIAKYNEKYAIAY